MSPGYATKLRAAVQPNIDIAPMSSKFNEKFADSLTTVYGGNIGMSKNTGNINYYPKFIRHNPQKFSPQPIENSRLI